MDKLRNIKNRLSVSVDKISPSRRSKSQQRKSMPLGATPLSIDVQPTVRTSRADERPMSTPEAITISPEAPTRAEKPKASETAAGSRPVSYCEVPSSDVSFDTATDSVDVTVTDASLDVTGSEEWLPDGDVTPVPEAASSEDIIAPDVMPVPIDPDRALKRESGQVDDSLVSQVMKEVQRIADLPNESPNQTKRLKTESQEKEETTGQPNLEESLKNKSINENMSESQGMNADGEVTPVCEIQKGDSVLENRVTQSSSVTTKTSSLTSKTSSLTSEASLLTSSTCRAESMTSGYLSDSDMTLSDSGQMRAFIPLTSEYTQQSYTPQDQPTHTSQEQAKIEQAKSEQAKTSQTKSILTPQDPTNTSSISEEQTKTASSSQEQAKSNIVSQEQTKTIIVSQDQTKTSITSHDKAKLAFFGLSEENESLGETKEDTSETRPIDSATPSAFTSVTPHKPIEPETVTPAAPAAETKPTVTKKESIYSRIMKKAKDSTKEPIYAKIKPKLTIETSFQPIEPSVGKNTWKGGGVVKPEPIYSTVKPRDPGGPLVPSGPVSCPTSPLASISAPFAPVGVAQGVKNKLEPIYSKVKPREARSSTLPRDPTKTGTLPKDPLFIKGKEHIYTQPLPPTPKEEEEARKRESMYSQEEGKRDSIYNDRKRDSVYSSDYGKVTCRVGEIAPSSPSRPAVITINNPGYAAPSGLPSQPSSQPSSQTLPAEPSAQITQPPPTTPYISPPCLSYTTSSLVLSPSSPKTPSKSVSMSPTAQVKLINKTESQSHSKMDSSNSLVESSDTESTGKTRLSNLVEELAQELEAVSRRLGNTMDTDEHSKKEVLAKLLSTYDVPKNLRRVEEADESEILEAEQALVPASISMDELRFVDEESADTVYADVPDYSQDEFVIALDDENDPRYASLTREMRRQKTSESPGRVSKRTAQVYTNAINVVTALKVLINSKSTRAATVLNKMGSLARPYAHRVQGNITDTTWIQRVIYHKSGHNGFDELRRYIKSGGEFCKELAVIMHERAELEASYAKGLHKLSGKLAKASKEGLGTVTQAWQVVAADLDHQGDIHRLVAQALADDLVRPLRQLIETQHKIRKGVESMVDKTTKNLHDWRAAEIKSKKQCHNNCRENEKIQDVMLEARLGRGKTLTDKEAVKLEKQRRKAEEAVQKSDLEYYTCCIRSERARLEWESAVYKGSSCFQTLEEERLQSLRDLVVKYHNIATESAPKLVTAAKELEEPVQGCDVEKDIQTVISAKGTGENIPEQLLPDFYAEDMNNIMNRERRKEALEKFSQMLRTDLERERRGKQGVENLAKALQETPTFGGEESQQDVNDKLQHMKAMLAYLEAARYKVQSSLDELSNRPKMTHPLAKHIEVHRDKQGLTCSVLKVPVWVRSNSVDVSPVSGSPAGSPNWNDRGTADGNSVQPDSDFDEFSSQGSDREYQNAMTQDTTDSGTKDGVYYAQPLQSPTSIGRCKALYDYEANMYDELSIRTGDIINIHEKQPDGWWVGELDNTVGIFPATYVEEID